MVDTLGYSVTVEGLEELINAANKYPEISEKHVRKSMAISVKQVENAVKPLTPVHTGRLRGSISSEVEGTGSEIIGRIGSSLKSEIYPSVMEFGRTPGARMPPPSALQRWVELVLGVPKSRSLGVAFVVARNIAKRGIKGKRFMKNGFEQSLPNIRSNFGKALLDIVREVAGKI